MSQDPNTSAAGLHPAAHDDRLDSWKAIAGHFGRSVRTVQRWKRTAGLPVYYVNDRIGSVYASRRELDAWLAGRSAGSESERAGGTTATGVLSDSSASAAVRLGRWPVLLLPAAALAIAAAMVTSGLRSEPIAGNGEFSAAREQVLRGQAFLTRPTPRDTRRAIEAFERAIEGDPQDAAAYAGLAQAYSRAANLVLPAADARRRSLEALNRALELDSTQASAYVARGLLLAGDRYDLEGARADFERAAALQGGSALARLYRGMMLIGLGQPEAGLQEIERAHRQDPLNMKISARLGMSYAVLGQPVRAISQCNQAIDLEPFSPEAHYCLGYALEHGHLYDRAIVSYRKSEELGMRTLPAIARTLARAGQPDEARAILRRIDELHEQGEPWPAYQVALIYAALGDEDAAFEALDRAYLERDSALVGLKIDPDLESLRADRRFSALVERMGLRSAADPSGPERQSYRGPQPEHPFERARR